MRLDWSYPEGPTRTHSDIAMWGDIVVAGNYDGFRVFDISLEGTNRLLVNKLCRGPQNDVSLWEHEGRLLLFLSNDTPQVNGETVCSVNRASDTTACGEACFEGVRIFDLSDPANPVLIKGVYTDCGSHTHTLVPDLENDRVLLYISSYPGSTGPRCQNPHGKISIVSVPLDAPETASVIAQPVVLPDVRLGVGCHDITVFLAFDIAAASCLSEGQFWDISDPANPGTLNPVHIDNAAVNVWHSASFTWDRQYVVFNDESFSGTCQPSGDGKIWIYRVSDAQLMSSFMIPRPQGRLLLGAQRQHHPGGRALPLRRGLVRRRDERRSTSRIRPSRTRSPSTKRRAAEGRPTRGRPTGTTARSTRTTSFAALDVFNIVLPGKPYGYPWTHLNAQTQEDVYRRRWWRCRRSHVSLAAP